jgi:hypothetical protein
MDSASGQNNEAIEGNNTAGSSATSQVKQLRLLNRCFTFAPFTKRHCSI